jgi:hypothetical protein
LDTQILKAPKDADDLTFFLHFLDLHMQKALHKYVGEIVPITLTPFLFFFNLSVRKRQVGLENTVCIRHIDKLNLMWWLDFGLKQFFAIAPTVPIDTFKFKKWSKVNPK